MTSAGMDVSWYHDANGGAAWQHGDDGSMARTMPFTHPHSAAPACFTPLTSSAMPMAVCWTTPQTKSSCGTPRGNASNTLYRTLILNSSHRRWRYGIVANNRAVVYEQCCRDERQTRR
jgi:hypothetical protein